VSWSVRGLKDAQVEFVLVAVEVDTNMSAACREFGISRKTGYQGLRRYKASGLEGLEDLSRRPRSSPLQLSGDAVVEVFRCYGLPDIIRSDNGSPFAAITGPQVLSRLSAWWLSLGIKPERTMPRHRE
jgi:hypothetical protein